MVRALYLAQNEATVTVGLLYQAPEASADASEASAAMQMRLAEESTLEKALSSVQKKLPQKADYRLCDFLIISENTSEEMLSAYESIVLESGRGRAAAKASILAVSTEELEKQLEAAEGLPDRLLNKLKGESVRLRLDCQRGDETPQPSAAQCAQLARLCTQTVQSFWQQGIDLVHLQQHSALQYGVGREKITIKNDCPQLQTVVRFLPG